MAFSQGDLQGVGMQWSSKPSVPGRTWESEHDLGLCAQDPGGEPWSQF